MVFENISERNRLEYKQKLTDDFEESVVAFLNYTEGGAIYIGVEDKTNKPVGVGNIDLVQRQISDRIKSNILPNALGLFDILIENVDGVEIVKVVVSSGIDKPYYIKKRGMAPVGCYLRVGSSNHQMTVDQIETLFAQRIPNCLSIMKSPRIDLTFDLLELYYTQKKLKLNKEYLQNLEMKDKNGDLNFLAYLLADDNGMSIKVAKYSGTDKLDLIENEEYGYKCIITATNNVIQKLQVENKTFAKVTSTTRHERKMMDEEALKEVFINAVVHNDYSRGVTPVVEIYSDKLTVTSYGGLPHGLSQENFFRGRTMPRNRELMRIFKDVGLVENLGSGMRKILDAYNQSIFTFEDNFLIVTFPFAEGFTVPNGTVNGTVNGNKKPLGAKNTILLCLEHHPFITLDTLSEMTGLSRRTVARQMKSLQESGVIKRVGADKTGYWEVYPNGNS
jgi:predicted HTH transcriptional regulator